MNSGPRWGLPLLAALLSLSACAHGQASVARDLAMNQDSLWTCRCAATSIASGRNAVDETQRLWIAADNKVVQVDAAGEVSEVWAAPRFSRILRLEPVDLDEDGSDEWIVLLDTGRMRSRIVALRDGSRVAVGKPWNGYLRPSRDRNGATVLFGQRSGGDRPFMGPVFRVDVADDLSLKSGESLELPRDFPLFDFFWLPGDAEGSPRLFSLEANGLLAERNPDSPRQVLWLSDARFVARPLQVEREYRGMLGDYRDGVIELAPPVTIAGGGDLPLRVHVVSQPPRGPVVVEGFMLPRGGDVRILQGAARGLEELARTPLMGRAVAGLVRWQPRADRTVGAALVWTRLEGGVLAPETRLLLFDPETGDLLSDPLPFASEVGGEVSPDGPSPMQQEAEPRSATPAGSAADEVQPAPAEE